MTRLRKRISRLLRRTAVLAAVLVIPTLLTSAPAAAWIPIIPPIYLLPPQATVWAYAPTTPEYRLNGGYTKNNYGDVVIRRTGVGAYTVTLENAGSTVNGVAHVVAYGSNPVFCTVADSYPLINSTVRDHIIKVRCFNAMGTPIDSQFVATYTNVRNIHQGRLRYFTTDQARPSGVRTVPSTMSYDSTGAPTTYERVATGRYKINWPPDDEPVDVPAYMLHVTAVGSTAVHCQMVPVQQGEWWTSEVWCRNAFGQLIDSRFSMTYGSRVDLLGNSTGRFSTTSYHASWHLSTYPTYNTEVRNTWYSAEKTTLGTGRYQFTIQKMATTYGTAFISADKLTAPDGYCVLASWGPSGEDEIVRINCYRYGGSPANTEFRLSFTTWPAG